jgi:F-type H+-transporting ATPase subunit a
VGFLFLSGVDTLMQAGHAAADTLHAAVDTVHAAGAGSGSEIAEFLLEHVQDSHHLETPFGSITLPHFDPIQFMGMCFDLSITKHVVFLWIAAFLLIVGLGIVGWQNSKRKVPRGFGNMIEIVIVFIRDEIVLPNMGPGGMKYIHYLLTTFFFILIMNLLGLFPWGASATGNVNVTAGLAIIAFMMIQISAIRSQGVKHYLAHLTGGVHWALWPIMIPIEILGLFTKPFALCIRLFANMTGGHLVILFLLGLIFIFAKIPYIAPVPVLFAVGINLLEIFVAFLQAYVFTMLTSLFMGLGMQQEEHSTHKEHL